MGTRKGADFAGALQWLFDGGYQNGKIFDDCRRCGLS